MQLTKKGYMPRLIDKAIEENLEIFAAISIEGPKWCGKTQIDCSKSFKKSFKLTNYVKCGLI